MSQLISDCIIYDLSQEKSAQVFYRSHNDFLSTFILTPKEFHHHIQHLLPRGKFENFALTIFHWKYWNSITNQRTDGTFVLTGYKRYKLFDISVFLFGLHTKISNRQMNQDIQ